MWVSVAARRRLTPNAFSPTGRENRGAGDGDASTRGPGAHRRGGATHAVSPDSAPRRLARPAPCDLWEVRDVVGHLTCMAERFRGTVSRAVRGDVSPPAGSPPVGTSTQAGRRAFVARQALACRESLGDQLFPTFRAQMDQFIALLAQLGPQEWEKPAYSALRLVPLWTYPYLTLREIAIHAWDIRSRFDPAARLSVESVPALMQGIALQLGPPWDAAFGQDAGLSRPVRSRWEVTGVVPGRYDIVGENGTCRIEPASTIITGEKVIQNHR